MRGQTGRVHSGGDGILVGSATCVCQCKPRGTARRRKAEVEATPPVGMAVAREAARWATVAGRRGASRKLCTGVSSGANFNMVVPDGDDKERAVCGTCGFIQYRNPLIVGGVVATVQDKVLLLRRDIEPRRGMWTIPGGFMECGESVPEGACRRTVGVVTRIPHASHAVEQARHGRRWKKAWPMCTSATP